MIITLYDILGVSSTASSLEIKAAYKTLAKQYHPDKNPGSTWHEEQFKKINHAYQILSDPSQRRIYDYRLEYERFNQQRPFTPKTPPQPQPKKQSSTNTRTQTNQQKKRAEPQYQRPPVIPDTWMDKFFEKIFKPIKSLSDKTINIYVISYYFVGVMLLGSYYELLDNSKTNELFEQAERYTNYGRYHEAIAAYNTIISIDEDNQEAYEKRAFLKLKEDWNSKSILEDLNDAIKYNDEPSDSLLFTRAKLLVTLHQYDQAIADLNSILAKDEEEEKRKLDSAYFQKAEINYFLKKYDQAIKDYTSFIKFQPYSGEAHTHRAYCYYDKKIYKAAIYDFNFSIQLKPENAENYYYRAQSKLALKDSSNACQDFHDSFLLGYSDAGIIQTKICRNYQSDLY